MFFASSNILLFCWILFFCPSLFRFIFIVEVDCRYVYLVCVCLFAVRLRRWIHILTAKFTCKHCSFEMACYRSSATNVAKNGSTEMAPAPEWINDIHVGMCALLIVAKGIKRIYIEIVFTLSHSFSPMHYSRGSVSKNPNGTHRNIYSIFVKIASHSHMCVWLSLVNSWRHTERGLIRYTLHTYSIHAYMVYTAHTYHTQTRYSNSTRTKVTLHSRKSHEMGIQFFLFRFVPLFTLVKYWF